MHHGLCCGQICAHFIASGASIPALLSGTARAVAFGRRLDSRLHRLRCLAHALMARNGTCRNVRVAAAAAAASAAAAAAAAAAASC